MKQQLVYTRNEAIDVKVYEPENPKAAMLLLHGISEHSGRYDYLLNFFKEHDIYGVVYDHNGHGSRDNGNRGEIGSFETLVRDAKDVYDSLPEDLPKFVIGHSMGSIVLRLLLSTIQPAGAIIVGTGNRTSPMEMIETAFVNGVAKVLPDAKSLFINRLAFSGFDRQVEGTARNRWISKNYENVVNYNKDPLSGHPVSINTFKAVNNAIFAVNSEAVIGHYSKDTNFLLISGKDDPFSHNGRDVEVLDATLKAHGLHTKSVLYEGYRHEILNEDIKNDVYRMILEWMDTVIDGE
ncbi:alpha/beta fold hydrolase [Nosocomiicoccus sp. HMSC059G07]|uniref:alpha/beta fold hydrolase n=1 Tax=Nosocomiicoccus sp. HMSC059G07 TaxID=1739531 RepID=UPI0008A42C81|nr:alpha/beta hydrolase [Nosocomiicoccus sp. HMSC059G07]OFO50928.1 hypothetical protein HMPREF3029_08275 [Nosocomiicoccus sp. HMSC059G07]